MLFFALLLFGCASAYLVPDAERVFERVVEAPGYSKEQIFNGTKIWIAENFKSAKAVLEYENKDDGIIIGNGSISYPCSGSSCFGRGDHTIPFTMRVDIKDQRFRLTFSNLRLTCPPSYNKYFGAQSGINRPLVTRGEFDAVRPALLKFGDQLLASLSKDKRKDKW